MNEVKNVLLKKMMMALLVTGVISGTSFADEKPVSVISPASKTSHYANDKQRVSAYMHALFVERDLAKIETFWGKEMIQHNPQMPNGHAVLRDIIGKLSQDFRYEQGLIAQDGDKVMVHGRYIGWGPKPMVAVDIFRLEHGKIVEHWDVMQEEVAADKSVNGHSMFPAKAD